MSTIHTIYPEDADPEFLKAHSDASLDRLAMEAYKRLASMRRKRVADPEGDLIRTQILAEISRRRADRRPFTPLLDNIPLYSFNEHARELQEGTFTEASLSYRKALAIEALEKLDRLQTTSIGTAEIDLAELMKIRGALRIGLGIPIH